MIPGVPQAAAPLRALVLSDGVAGHDRICLGVLAALRRRQTVDEAWIGVRERRAASRRWDRVFAQTLPFDTFWRERFAFVDDAPAGRPRARPDALGRPDVVIAAGPSLAAATLAVARRFGARSVQFGFPKFPLLRQFDVLLRPDHGRWGLTEGVSLLRPSEIDPDALPVPRPPSAPVLRVAVLIGGDTKHYAFRPDDFEALGQAFAAEPRAEILVFNSRRTPEALFDAFAARFGTEGAGFEVVDVRSGGFLSNAAAYAADVVLVTADSMSMIAEAIAARRPTLIVRPDGYAPPRRDAAEIAEHVRAGLAAEATLSSLSAGPWLTRVAGLTPLAHHPLDRLADALLG